MTPPSEAPAGGRLHPAAIGVWSVAALGPGAFLLLAGGAGSVVPLVFVALSALAGVVKYLRFTWAIDHGALVIEQGLLERRRRVIPFDRIQSVEVVRGLRHRLFGVVELRVETVGSSDAEGRLDALDPALAHRVRAILLRQAEAPAGIDGEARVDLIARVPPGKIVVAGLTGGRVGVAAALFGLGQDLIGDRIERLLPMIDTTEDLWLPAIILTVVLAGAFVLSIVMTVVTYWGFELARDGDVLRVRRGLLEQRSETIPANRIQALWLEENFVRRLFGLAAVRAVIAGRSGGQDAQVSGMLLPIAPRAEALRVMKEVLGNDGTALSLQAMPPAARTKRLVRAGVATVVVTAAAAATAGPLGLAAVGLAAPLGLLALASYRALGWAATADLVVSRSGVMVRRTSWARPRRLQSVALLQTPFQRRVGLATLYLHLARNKAGGGDPRLIDLDESDAWRLLRDLPPDPVSRTRDRTPAAP